MWGASVLPALVASAVVSGLFLAFFVLEHCVNAQCPYKKKGPTPSVPLPRVNTEVLMQLAREAVWEEPWESLAANSFLCIAKSQMACLATITFAWCTAACALLLLLSVLCPNPRPEEVVAFRNSSVFSFLQQAVMLTYLAGVEGCFQDATLCLLFWCSKYCSRQLQSVLPLRSEAIRKARQVNTKELLTLFSAYSSGAVLSSAASVVLWSVRPWMSPIVFFELWALPLDALAFLNLAFSESLHIAEEVSVGGKASEPLVTAEKRMELSQAAALLQGTVKGAVILCHRIAMLCCFGVQWRLADMVLLMDIRLLSRRVLLNVQNRLQHSIAQSQTDKSYPCATSDEIEDDSPCPICQASLRCEGISQSNVPKRLPCGHIFHLSCVVRWITHNQGKCVACPMCRTQLQTTKEAFSCWQVTVASAIEWWMECPWQLVRWVLLRMSHRLPPRAQAPSAVSPPPQQLQPDVPQPPSPSVSLHSDAHDHTPLVGRDDARRLLQEYLHMREAVLSSQIVQDDLARFQAEMRDTRTPANPTASSGSRGWEQSPGTILGDLLGVVDPAPPPGDLPVPEDVMTPAWAPALGRAHRNGANTAAQQDFGVSDAMVGTEVAALVLQSPLWSMISPSSTGRSNRRRV